jgi:hypothetical protein
MHNLQRGLMNSKETFKRMNILKQVRHSVLILRAVASDLKCYTCDCGSMRRCFPSLTYETALQLDDLNSETVSRFEKKLQILPPRKTGYAWESTNEYRSQSPARCPHLIS